MLDQLRTLIAISRHGTFAAAGERIGLTQAAVSGHIKRLEDTLGFPLFERTGRSARLNAEGQRTLARALTIVADVDRIGAPLEESDWQGTLQIGAIASVQSTLLARAMPAFRQQLPRCRLHIVPGLSLHLIDQLDAGLLDLALVIRPPGDLREGLVWTPLLREDYALIAPAGSHGDDWRATLCGQPFLRYSRASFGGRQVERFLREAAMQVDEWIEIDDLHALVAMVAAGLGAAIIPMAENLLPLPSTVRRLDLGPHQPFREIGLASRRGDVSRAGAIFSDSLRP